MCHLQRFHEEENCRDLRSHGQSTIRFDLRASQGNKVNEVPEHQGEETLIVTEDPDDPGELAVNRSRSPNLALSDYQYLPDYPSRRVNNLSRSPYQEFVSKVKNYEALNS